MYEIKGKFASALLTIDNIEQTAISQIYDFLNNEAFEGSNIVIMPDVHAGKGAVVGFTGTLTDKVIPNVIGVDIGCRVKAVNLGKISFSLEKLDSFIKDNIPSGFSVNGSAVDKGYYAWLAPTCDKIGMPVDRAVLSLGTLGGGNHFIEVGKDSSEELWLTVHSGSRGFGKFIAEFHQNTANECRLGASLSKVIKKDALSCLKGEYCSDYLTDMRTAQTYADLNVSHIVSKIMHGFFNFVTDKIVESVHNYIDFDRNIIRKGAISAELGRKILIPLNMRDGVIIAKGRGNADWNYSAPHGAGRNHSRSQAKKNITMAEYQQSMEGIYSSCISEGTLDEAPQAYKDSSDIINNLTPTAEILDIIKPIYSFKANENKKQRKGAGSNNGDRKNT